MKGSSEKATSNSNDKAGRMKYRDNVGNHHISLLGFGCMRFPKKGTGFDMDEIERELLYAVDNGVNYFDTAYIYGGSEEVLGVLIEKNHLRDKINIATKLPHYMMKTMADAEKNFREQLRRLKTDHIDYYLMHMIPDVATWQALIDRGVLDWIKEKKESGQIRNLGFSYHGGTPMFLEILNAYDWDFCQIQYNYLDENSQAGRKGLMAAHEKGIPVIIMEPLRGGRLVDGLPNEAKNIIKSSDRGYTPAEWGLRWLFDQGEVTTVLSGMNSMDMVAENIRIASESSVGELKESDFALIEEVIKSINSKMKVPCTGCSYCMPCPKGVDIPGSFRCFNTSASDGYIRALTDYFMCTAMKKQKALASQCVECGKCEQHCPQGIQIRNELKRVKNHFENPIFKLGVCASGILYKEKRK